MHRRKFLFGSAALATAGLTASLAPQAEASLPFSKSVQPLPTAPPPAGFTTVAPNSAWLASGSPGSGATTGWAASDGAPNDPLRVHAKPILKWWQPPHQRGVGNLLIAALGDALGGLQKVTFGGDIPDTDATLQFYSDTDVNGNTRLRPFYGIQIDCATAAAAHPTGALRIYVKGIPNATVGPMEARILGPLTIYPRTARYDWKVTVDPTKGTGVQYPTEGPQGNYTTLAAAMQGLKDALTPAGSGGGGKECGCVTIMSSAGDNGAGQYEWGHPDTYNSGNVQPWSYGFSTVTHASGVTANITRGTSFDPYNAGLDQTWDARQPWAMFTYVDNLEWRGSGIVIDRKNFRMIAAGSFNNNAYNLHFESGAQLRVGHYLFNGCKITNSNGTWPQTYWNGQPAPHLGIGDLGGNSGAVVWAQDCDVQYQFGNMMPFNYTMFNRQTNGCGTGYMMPTFVFGEKINNNPLARETYYRDTICGGMTISYSGSQATATMVYDAAHTITLQAGSAVNHALSIQDGTQYAKLAGPNPSYFVRFSEVRDYINANNSVGGTCEGFSAVLNDDSFGIWSVAHYYEGGGFSVDLKNGGPFNVQGNFKYHSEWIVWQNGATQNALVWNSLCTNSGWSSCWVNWGGVAGNMKDVSFKNVTFDSGSSGHNTGNAGATYGSHACMENVTMTDGLKPGQGFGTDVYSRITQVVALFIDHWNGPWSDNIPTNCIVAGSDLGPGAGIVALNGSSMDYVADWSPLFVNNAGGDWTPAPTRALAANLFPAVNARDESMAVRATNDAAGAWRMAA